MRVRAQCVNCERKIHIPVGPDEAGVHSLVGLLQEHMEFWLAVKRTADDSHPYKQNWQLQGPSFAEAALHPPRLCFQSRCPLPSPPPNCQPRRPAFAISLGKMFSSSALDQEAWGQVWYLVLDLFLSIKVLDFLVQFAGSLLPGNLCWTK